MKYRRPQPKRFAARSRALRVSSSRFLGGALMVSESISRRAIVVTSATALLNAASFACEGCVVPLSFRTNCNADARISSSVAGGSKFASVLMFLHMSAPRDARLKSGYHNDIGICRFLGAALVAWMEAGRNITNLIGKRDGNAIHRDGEGDQGLRGRRASHQTDARRDGQIQRRAGQGRRDAGGPGAAGLVQGCAHHLFR